MPPKNEASESSAGTQAEAGTEQETHVETIEGEGALEPLGDLGEAIESWVGNAGTVESLVLRLAEGKPSELVIKFSQQQEAAAGALETAAEDVAQRNQSIRERFAGWRAGVRESVQQRGRQVVDNVLNTGPVYGVRLLYHSWRLERERGQLESERDLEVEAAQEEEIARLNDRIQALFHQRAEAIRKRRETKAGKGYEPFEPIPELTQLAKKSAGSAEALTNELAKAREAEIASRQHRERMKEHAEKAEALHQQVAEISDKLARLWQGERISSVLAEEPPQEQDKGDSKGQRKRGTRRESQGS